MWTSGKAIFSHSNLLAAVPQKPLYPFTHPLLPQTESCRQTFSPLELSPYLTPPAFTQMLTSINTFLFHGGRVLPGRPFAVELLNPHRVHFTSQEVKELQQVNTCVGHRVCAARWLSYRWSLFFLLCCYRRLIRHLTKSKYVTCSSSPGEDGCAGDSRREALIDHIFGKGIAYWVY